MQLTVAIVSHLSAHSDLWPLTSKEHFFFLVTLFCENSGDACDLLKIPIGEQSAKQSDVRPAWHHISHVQRHINALSSPTFFFIYLFLARRLSQITAFVCALDCSAAAKVLGSRAAFYAWSLIHTKGKKGERVRRQYHLGSDERRC